MVPNRFRPQLETCDDRLCPSSTTTLPISAFLSQQGTTQMFGGAFPDEIAWVNSAFDPGTTGLGTTPGGETVFSLLLADYTGAAAKYLADHQVNVPTKITGFVTETPIAGTGLMEVSVNLEATGAVTTVARVPQSQLNGSTSTAPVAFGYRPEEVAANPALASKLAFSNVRLELTFMENVGEPLPDLVQAFILGNAPAGFSPERISFQSWGTGVVRDASPVGTPGQTAIASTWQVADLTGGAPGTYDDGFFQEPVDIIPLTSPTSNVGYRDGTLFVIDQGGKNDNITVTPTAGGGAAVSSNLGSGTYANVTRVVTALSGGNDKVTIGNLPGATVNVVAVGQGNKDIQIGNAAKGGIFVGDGNNKITAGTVAPGALFVGVSGSGNNTVNVAGGVAEILVAGNGNNRVTAAGHGDFIEVLGNGNNQITDTGANVQLWLGGDGNNSIDNAGDGSFTTVLGGAGRNRIRGPFGPYTPPGGPA